MLAVVNQKSGVSIQYFSIDSESVFRANCNSLELDWEYRHKKISYDFNDQGYRTLNWVDINWPESVVVIGCSYTFGLGLAVDDTLCHLLSKKFNRPFINLGVVGSSNHLILYNSTKLVVNGIRPKAVILLFSDPSRVTHFNSVDNTVVPLGNWVFPSSPVQQVLGLDNSKSLINFYSDYIRDGNCDVHGTMASIGAEALWKSKNVPTLAYAAYNGAMGDYLKSLPRGIDRSRDLSHPGIASNALWADFIETDLIDNKVI